MGEVHLARLPGELGFEKLLVIKTVRPELAADPRFVELFAAEAKTAVALNHPNITPIYELGRAEDGTLYAAMGWVDGPSLAQLCARHPQGLELAPALFILRELLDGLAHAHAGGPGRACVVHRDVTPRNVLIDRSGHVQLIDFGIAKPADSEAAGVMGSAGYMAPEQARGQRVDPRADVFAAGCVLFELLTGTRAFDSAGVWVVPSLESLPADLRPVLARCLALEANARFPDAGACLRALAPLLAAHAPAYASTELAALIAASFPEGWAPSEQPSQAGEDTPATAATIAPAPQPETFATRASFTPAPVENEAPPPESAPAALEPAPIEPSSRRSALVPALLVTIVVLLALLLVVLREAGSDRSTSEPVSNSSTSPSPPAAPSTSSAPPLPDDPQPPDPPELPAQIELQVSPAQASVELDGRALSGPPFELPRAPGHLSVHHPGHRTLELELDAQTPSPLRVELEPLGEGKLSVLAPDVAWAEVWLDGTRVGTTPLRERPLVEGRHRLEVRCTAEVCDAPRVLLERSVKIRAGRTTRLSTTD